MTNPGPSPSFYDPYQYRQVVKPLSNFEAFINLVKSLVGSGLLAMPMAFQNSGWVLGLIGTVMITSLLVCAMNLLLRGMYQLCQMDRVPELTYSAAMGVAFREGPKCFQSGNVAVVYLTDFFLCFFHFGICAVYVVFIAENTQQIVEHYLPAMNVRFYMLILFILILPIFLIRNLKHLVPFSALANILILVGIVGVLVYIFEGSLPSLGDRQSIQSIELLPLFFGTVLFALEAPGVVVALEASMAKPIAFRGAFGILSIGMMIVASLYASMGFLGYWRYGDSVEGSITLNLPQGAILSQVIKALFVVAIYFSYPLQGFVTIDILLNRYIFKHVQPERQVLTEYITRTLMVLLTVITAISIPQLGLILSLIGSLCLSVLGLIFPALMDICVRYHTSFGRLNIYLIFDIFLFLFGLTGGILGSVIAIKNIAESYMD